jgi:2-succinyl-6-hydroxy-2,4-cyclohexadiene-1-carboxylate synthase
MLYAEVSGTGPRLVLVHGFAQNRNCWGPVADDLATDHEVVRVDAPGHGRSSDVRAGLWDGAALMASRGGRGTYVGYSMGARFALHVALAHPEVVDGLVLIGGTAGLDDADARAERRAADDKRASQLEREGVAAFLEMWLALPLFAGLTEAMQFRDERGENTVDGLAASLRTAGTGSQDPLWPRLGELDMPLLAIAGAEDAKFTAEARRIVESVGTNAAFASVLSAGHSAHLENPSGFLAVLRPWLEGHHR